MKENPKNFFESNTKILLALILPAIFIYARSLKFNFTSMDEQWLIVKDYLFLEKWSSVKKAFILPSTEIYYRPLFIISLIIDYHFGKLSPFVYHFSNLAWHLLSVILVYKFLVHSEVQKKTAFVFTLLFSVHPILLHAVAWVPGRNDIMLSVFTLASLIHLKKFIDSSEKKHLLWQLFFFVCALFTKESAILLPLIFTAYYFVYKSPEVKKLMGFVFAWIALALLWLWLRNTVAGSIYSSPNGFITNLENFIAGFLVFIGKTLYPLQQSVLPTLKNTSLIPGIITVLLITILCFKPGLKNKKIAFLGLFIFFILLSIPVWFGASKSGSEHYEQRIYGAMAGMLLFLTQIKFNVNSKVVVYSAGLLFALFVIKTSTRLGVYKNKLSFIEAGINECPDYHLFYLQKADILNDEDKFEAALPFYNKAIELRPNYPQLHSNRGSAYFRLGRYKEAIADFSKAIDYSSDFNKLYYLNRCTAYSKINDAENAMRDLVVLKKCCQEIIKADLEKKIMDKWIDGMETLKNQAALEQNNAGLFRKIAGLYFDIEMNEQGLTYISQAIILDPNNESYKKLKQEHETL